MAALDRRALIQALCAIVAETDSAQDVVEPFRGIYRRVHRELEVGAVQGRVIRFTHTHRQIIHYWLRDEGIDPATGLPEESRSRTELARHQLDEKRSANSIASSYSLVALGVAGDQPSRLNGVPLVLPAGGFLTLPAATAHTSEADWLLTVENYETFLTLCADPARLARTGRGLLVFRHAPAFPAGMDWARRVSAQYGIPHWHAPDFDPQGLSHCVEGEQQLAGAWLPDLARLPPTLASNPALYDKQQAVLAQLDARLQESFPTLADYAQRLHAVRGGWTQERLFAGNVPFRWLANCARG